MHSERGFTLIELLTIIAIIGILSSLALSGFSVYRASAAYAVASQALHDARSAMEASIADQGNLPEGVPLQSQLGPGAISDPLGQAMLPGMQVPRNIKIQYSYDPECMEGGCVEALLQTNHCFGMEYPRFMRFGDGLEMLLEHVSGSGCS